MIVSGANSVNVIGARKFQAQHIDAPAQPLSLRCIASFHLQTCLDRIYIMAEPIGIASGLVALTTFAFQSSIALYKTVRSFRTHPRDVRELLEQLDALGGVLDSLLKTVQEFTDLDLSSLEKPLRRCGNACQEFEQELLKCAPRSGDKATFRGWAKLKYLGDDIDTFRRSLATYAATINVALADANL